MNVTIHVIAVDVPVRGNGCSATVHALPLGRRFFASLSLRCASMRIFAPLRFLATRSEAKQTSTSPGVNC